MSEFIPARVRAKRFLKRFLPASAFRVINTLWIRGFARFFKVQGIVERYTAQFIATEPLMVHGGPFAGMQYVDRAVGSNYLHKLIGSYEAVLHPYLEQLQRKPFDTIIDIGAAEGYYLIGLGRLFPEARLVGFETEAEGRGLIEALYTKNALKNQLVLEGEATAENVVPYLTERSLLVCDCEGGEMDILRPDLFNAYSAVDTFIIELHDFIRPGIKQALLERFSSTHTATIVPFKMAETEAFPFLKAVENNRDRFELRRERGWQEQEWLVLVKHA